MGEKVEYNEDGYMQGVDEDTGEVLWKQKMKPSDKARLDSGLPIRKNMQQINDMKDTHHWVNTPAGTPVWAKKGTNPDHLPQTVWPYSKVLAAQICQKLTEGLSLTAIGKIKGYPPTHVIYHWARKHKEFKADMSQAKKDRAEYYADQALDIALSTNEKDDVPAASLKVKTLQWAAQAGAPEDFAGKPQGKGDSKPAAIVIVTGVPRKEEEAITVEGREIDECKEPNS